MRASDTFRHPVFRHNCAQAVANKYKDLFPDPSSVLDQFQGLAAGRAEGGMCGALFAAISACPDQREAIIAKFKECTGGFLTCSDIKSLSGTPCKACVDAADDILSALAVK